MKASARKLTIAMVGPFPPPFGGMASYYSRLKAGILAHDYGCQTIPLRFTADGRPARFERIRTFLAASLRVLGTRTDIVHCITGSQPNLVANGLPLLVARMRGKPSVLSIVGGELPEVVAQCGRWRRLLLRMVLSLPSLVIACNAEIEAALRELGVPDDHHYLLTNALPAESERDSDVQSIPAAFTELCRSHHPIVLSISAWFDWYGSLDLARAVANLKQVYPRLGMVLICKQGGDEAFRTKFESFVESRGIGESVLALENIPGILPLMRRADVFVRTPHHEGDSISVREALEVGRPVVASDAGHRPAGVVLYRPADSDDLAAKLTGVLRSLEATDMPAEDRLSEGSQNLQRILQSYEQLVS